MIYIDIYPLGREESEEQNLSKKKVYDTLIVHSYDYQSKICQLKHEWYSSIHARIANLLYVISCVRKLGLHCPKINSFLYINVYTYNVYKNDCIRMKRLGLLETNVC